MHQNLADGARLSKLHAMIKATDFCMFTTLEADGALRSRPMSTQEFESDGDLWFFTPSDAFEADAARRDRRVNLSYSTPDKGRFISLSGTAELVTDRRKKEALWSPLLRAWFPKGLEDPNLSLLRVRIEQGDYWDDSSNKMVPFFETNVRSADSSAPATLVPCADHR